MRAAQPTPELPDSTARPSLCGAPGSVLPCPFCGISAHWFIQSDDAKEYWVECGVCKATGPKTTIRELTAFEWNRRRSPNNQAHTPAP